MTPLLLAIALALMLAGCDRDDGRVTWRDAVLSLCEPFCERAVACGDQVDEPRCVASCMDSICDDDSCAPKYEGSWDLIDACARKQLDAACPARDLVGCDL